MAEIDDDIAALPEEETPVEEVATVEAAPTAEEPEAVELKPGERYVPLAALTASRAKVAELKTQAERAGQLEAELNQTRPYAEFLRNNPHLLKPAEPAAPAAPTENPAAVEFAKEYDLYTPDGKPDVARATRILDKNRAVAREEAQAALQPLQESADFSRAQANLQSVQGTKDANGQALEQQYIDAAVLPIVQNMSKAQALKVLADPQVAQLIRFTALGYQAANKKAGPVIPKPETAPLHVEVSGGGQGYTMTDHERRMAKATGRTEKDWTETAKKFKPGDYNTLE